MPKPLPPLELLREHFAFSEDGVITLKKKRGRGDHSQVGDVLGCPHGNGYLDVRFGGILYFVHRLVFYHFNGWCPDLIDHKDRNRKNNHPDNLRVATHSQNHANGTKYQTKSAPHSQLRGVTKSRGKWMAQIVHNQRRKYLGRFASEKEAHDAYLNAAASLFAEFVL